MKTLRDPAQLSLHRLIPAEVRGFYQRRRDTVHFVLMLVFIILPWTSINSSQTLLFDIPQRKFHFFGLILRAHDVPLLFLILSFFFLSLAFVTSLWGRVWCGWACPQTVFIEAVYRRIEKWVEGDYIQRRLQQNKPVTAQVFLKKVLKWTLFFLVSALIAHSLVAYFVGAPQLFEMITRPPRESWTYFVFTFALTSLLTFNFGWFREQFCVILCPYGRFQNVLLDPGSVAIAYDESRGEPRRGINSEKKGDCIDCGRCVEVCPTGIDIRNGLQLECINCTACIDACNEIMARVKKPSGLIRYKTIDNRRFSIKSLKTASYVALLSLCLVSFAVFLIQREPLDVTVLRETGLPFTTTEAHVINRFKIHLINQSSQTSRYSMSLPEDLEWISAQKEIELTPGASYEWHVLIRVPRDLFKESAKITSTLSLISKDGAHRSIQGLTLIGPHL